MSARSNIRITELRTWAAGKFAGFRAEVEGASLSEDSDLHLSDYLVADIAAGARTEILAVAKDGARRSETLCRIELACALANFLHAEVDSGITPT